MRLIDYDSWLKPFLPQLQQRRKRFLNRLAQINSGWGSLKEYASAHLQFGLHFKNDEWHFSEWAPNAKELYLVGEFSDWKPEQDFRLTRGEGGIWSIKLHRDILKHGDHYKLWMVWEGGAAMRIPAYAQRTVQDPETLLFSAQVWYPNPFQWDDHGFSVPDAPALIYEAHTGMAQDAERVGSYIEFAENILPRIKEAGYNTLQLMAVQEHPYYGSFGYHVSNFFAPSGRFGTPEDLKFLVNKAHQMGIAVIMDLVHSHSVKNEEEGLSRFDGTSDLYFHYGSRGEHPAWDSRCFDYGKDEVQRFLLSNCRYWIEEFHFDGFRFDGVTSMLYFHHGLEKDFTSYDDYFDGQQDEDAMLYLAMANELIHTLHPKALSLAEEMSGMPGITLPGAAEGLGFDYRLSMGVPDFWIKLIKEKSDEEWNVGQIFHELTQHRPEEKIVSYVESHDQALVGDKTIIFRLADKEMYDFMSIDRPNLIIDRAIALHKMIRLITIATAYGGYLNFMGNEFGHPEWIDFPREGNNWSYQYARRQWSLYDNKNLKFKWLGHFDKAMIHLASKEKINEVPEIYLKSANTADQVLAFERGGLLFIFNFHPTKSYTNYGIPINAGKFKIVLSSDDEEFGGFKRVDKDMSYYTRPLLLNKTHHHLQLYIPSRMAMVLKRQPIKSVYG